MLLNFVLIILIMPSLSFIMKSCPLLKPSPAKNVVGKRLSCFMSTSSRKVAICGGGISCCAAANELSKKGFEVHIFEGARGLGGRTATRRSGDYYFDHGAPFIGTPKTDEFKNILNEWKTNNWIAEWNGKFGMVKQSGVDTVDSSSNPRYVALPYMNHLCKNLAQHDKITCHFQTKAIPSIGTINDSMKQEQEEVQWTIEKATDNSIVGTYDWVIVGDRGISSSMKSTTAYHQHLLDSINTHFTKPILQQYESIPVVALMVVLPSSAILAEHYPFASVDFASDTPIGSILSRITNDSTKPARGEQVGDGKTCWVVQSTVRQAQVIMDEVNRYPGSDKFTFEQRRAFVNQLSEQTILPAFKEALLTISQQQQSSTSSKDDMIVEEIEKLFSQVEIVIGHRWSAGFSGMKQPLHTVLSPAYYDPNTRRSFVDPNTQFAACGDYLVDTPILSTVEGAVLSGVDVAQRISQYYNK